MTIASADLSRLLPSFQPLASKLLEALRERGFSPIARGSTRTPEQAAANAQRGTGIRNSLHLYGAALDVICGEHRWACHEHECGFFEALGEVAESLGLTWGGRWHRNGRGPDLPHVQCIAVHDQGAFRSLATREERDAFVAARLVRHG